MKIYEAPYIQGDGTFFFVLDQERYDDYLDIWVQHNGQDWREGWISQETLEKATVVFEEDDMVRKPPHYQIGGMDCLDVIQALELDFMLANAFKYIWRAGRKGPPRQDIEKAHYYLERWLEHDASK